MTTSHLSLESKLYKQLYHQKFPVLNAYICKICGLVRWPLIRDCTYQLPNAKAEREGRFFFFKASPSRSEFWECSKNNSYSVTCLYMCGDVELLQLLFFLVLFGFVNGELQMKWLKFHPLQNNLYKHRPSEGQGSFSFNLKFFPSPFNIFYIFFPLYFGLLRSAPLRWFKILHASLANDSGRWGVLSCSPSSCFLEVPGWLSEFSWTGTHFLCENAFTHDSSKYNSGLQTAFRSKEQSPRENWGNLKWFGSSQQKAFAKLSCLPWVGKHPNFASSPLLK